MDLNRKSHGLSSLPCHLKSPLPTGIYEQPVKVRAPSSNLIRIRPLRGSPAAACSAQSTGQSVLPGHASPTSLLNATGTLIPLLIFRFIP